MTTLPPKLIRSKPGNIELTERDRLIISSVYRFRFLTTDQLQVITNTKGRRVFNRRLKELFDAKLLDRPKLQHTLYSHSVKRPLVHALGNEGAKLIEQLHGISLPSSVRWTDKNNKIKKPEYIQHALGVADVVISLEQQLSNLPNEVSYSNQNEVIALSPARPGKRINPLSLPTSYRWWTSGDRVTRSTVADAVFAFTDDRGEKTKQGLLFVEYDGNTMPVVRRTPSQSSIIQKMLGYADARDRKLQKKYFGYNNFRVLFVTRDRDRRIASMQEAWEQHAAHLIPAGAFLFADYDDLIKHSPLGNIWTNAKGERANLILNFSLN
jgi:hypothetical protein